jgi:hypothetical protein
MSSLTSLTDFKKPDGNVDWKAYDAAQVANGEKCYRCGGIASLFGRGHRSLCGQCEELDSDRSEVLHDSLVRCPHCRHAWNVYEGDNYALLKEDTHQVTCPECEREFEVETRVSYSFTSRPSED